MFEKLEGDCLRCHVPATYDELVNITLKGGLETNTALAAWLTNATHWFLRLPDVHVLDGVLQVTVPRDTILTLTTTTGQTKGSAGDPPSDGPVRDEGESMEGVSHDVSLIPNYFAVKHLFFFFFFFLE